MKSTSTLFSKAALRRASVSTRGLKHNLQQILSPKSAIVKVICTIVMAGSLFSGSLRSQTLCDSLQIDSVQVQSGYLWIFFSNTSQQSIVYPMVVATLNSNSYLAVSNNAAVSSYLDVAGGANNGVTQFSPALTQTTSPNLVPLNTVFTGTASLYDPNDSSFYCLFQFSFTYGTLTGNAIDEPDAQLNTLSVYPDPAADYINVSLKGVAGQNANITITNALGEIVLLESIEIGNDKSLNKTINTEMVLPGIYFLEVSTDDARVSTGFVKE